MKKLLFYLFISLPVLSFSQNLQFKNYTPFDGLSTLKTSCITQGSDGYIWVGTDNGLNRFDGVNFKLYTKDIHDTTSLPGNVILSLLVDSNGELWIATDGGVCGYNKEIDQFFSAPVKRLDTTYCKSIIQDSKNNYWAITGSTITVYDHNWKEIKTINKPKDKNYIGNVSFFTIAEDNNGIMWIGTQEKGLFSYNLDNNRFTRYDHLIKENDIFHIYPDSYGNIWIGTHGTPYVFKKETGQIFDLNSPGCPYNLPNLSMSHFFEDTDGIIWICNWRNGITKYNFNTNTYSLYEHSNENVNSFSPGSVECGYQDIEGNYWFVGATTGVTVSYANPRKIFKLSAPDSPQAGIFHNPATAITQDLYGNYWFGSDGGGISIWNAEEGIVRDFFYTPEDSTSYGGPSVLTAYTDSKGRIWSGGYNSYLNLYNPEDTAFTVFKTDGDATYQVSGPDVRAITEDDNGNIWVATNGAGVNIYNPDNFNRKILTVKDGIASNKCISLLNDNEGNIWIGSYGGLTIYNVATGSSKVFIKNENDPYRFQSNWINALFKDSKNNYWIGTQVGLVLFDPSTGSCKNYLESDGLINHSIMSIEEASDGNLWIGTMDGLSRFNPTEQKFTNYDIYDGLPDNQFRMGSSIKGNDNNLYFGTNKGIIYFDPKKISKNTKVPQVRFTHLFVNNELVIPKKTGIVTKSIDYTKTLKLKKNQNFFRINFTAISFYQAEKNKFRYFLDGIDKDWIDSKTNYASYTNLKHGRYTFRVQAFNNDGIPSEIREIKIRIKPKWYNTFIFWFVVISSFIYLVYHFVKERKDHIRVNKEKLEQKIKENKHQLNEKIKELELKEEEIVKKNKEDLEIKFLHEGISMFSSIISKNRENIDKLSSNLISELVGYIGATAGIVYVVDESDVDPVLKPTALYRANVNGREENYIKVGEGYVGTCFVNKQTIIIDNLPDSYFMLTSGLGNTNLRHAVLAPIQFEDTCLGVFELASLDKLEEYKIEFINKLSGNFASALAITKASIETKKMLEQNQLQSDELKAQKEEIRQNLEEMQATQEELKRQMKKAEQAHTEMQKEKVLIDTLLKYAPENIYFKDENSKIIKASHSMTDSLKVKSLEEIYGKSDFDFFTEEHARPAFDDEQNIIRTGKPIIDKIEKETHSDGTIKWVSTSKMPLYDEKGHIIGTFGISKDVTESQNLQEEIKMQNQELQAQEEELRQNLKEMCATQDELEHQIKISNEAHTELAKEKALIDTMLKYIPDSIYFKDKDSKFIKASHSMASHFRVKNVKEIYGKSDFDFYTDEHASPAFEDEQEIIRTGKPIFDKKEKETHIDGSIKWVNTSKMPLYDDNGSIAGTFGISKDITESKRLQEEVKVQNDELQAQEEELRQSLEEMRTIQDEMFKNQHSLENEIAMFETLLDFSQDRITIKDTNGVYLRINKTKAEDLNLSDSSDAIGKTDADFFCEEHSKKALKEEKELLKIGNPILNDEEQIKFKDGSIQMGSTSRIPFRNSKNEIIGTLVITKNISK